MTFLLFHCSRIPIEADRNNTPTLVGMPKTPGQSDLPFTQDEVLGIRDLLPKSISIVTKQTPAKQDIVEMLRRVQIVHLACHGQSVCHDPSQSLLLLKDWQTDPLTVGD